MTTLRMSLAYTSGTCLQKVWNNPWGLRWCWVLCCKPMSTGARNSGSLTAHCSQLIACVYPDGNFRPEIDPEGRTKLPTSILTNIHAVFRDPNGMPTPPE